MHAALTSSSPHPCAREFGAVLPLIRVLTRPLSPHSCVREMDAVPPLAALLSCQDVHAQASIIQCMQCLVLCGPARQCSPLGVRDCQDVHAQASGELWRCDQPIVNGGLPEGACVDVPVRRQVRRRSCGTVAIPTLL